MVSYPNGNIQDAKPGSSIKHNHPRPRPIKAQPKHGNQPTPRPALPEQTRPDTDCHPVHSPTVLLTSPLQSRGSHPTACPLPPASLSPVNQSSATALQDNTARQRHSVWQSLSSLLTGWPREQRQRGGVYLSLHTCTPVRSTYITLITCYMCIMPTRRQTAIRREWELVIVKALGDCHRALSSSGSSKAVHAAKHRGGHPAPCTMKQDTRQSPGLRVR